MELARDTLLQAGKYKIIGKLGQGGFGIAYLAHHQNLNRDVCIKEFFYSDLCERANNNLDVTIITKSAEKLNLVNTFKKKFTKEAQRLAKFQHPNIVQVTDTFEENNTAYFVMEYLQGGSLEELLSREGALSEQKTKELILPLIDALDAIHKKDLLHLDIKPANIMLRNNQTPVLIDFGISKYMELAGGVTTTAPVGISKGYTPLEQYTGSISDFSNATDIYSLCATIYKMVTGITPPEPLQMLSNGFKSPKDLRPEISIQFNAAIVKGLATKKADRHQTMAILEKGLGAKKNALPSTPLTVIEVEEPVPATANEYFKRAEKRRENKQYKEAIDDYTDAIKMKSNESDYFFYRAWCESKLKNVNNAIKDYSTAIELDPKHSSEAFNNRGVCYSSIYRYEDAINDYYKAYEIKKDNLYFNNWINAVEGSRFTKTLDEHLSHDWPEKYRVYVVRGKMYLNMGEREKALKDFEKAKEINGFLGWEDEKLLKSLSWKSSEILYYFIALIISNIIAVISLLFVLNNDISIIDYKKWHWTLIPMIISIFFSFYASYPHKEAWAKFHVNTDPSFQHVEKLIYSFIHIYLLILLFIVVYWFLVSKDYSIAENRVAMVSLTSVFVTFPTYSLYLIWAKSKNRNI